MSWTELSYTLKLIVRNFHFSLLCILVIGGGIGLSLTLYSFIHNASFAVPPIVNGERFVAFNKKSTLRTGSVLSTYDAFHYHYFKDNSHAFELLAGWRRKNSVISDGAYAEAWRNAEMEPVLLKSTGVQVLKGRLFTDADTETGAMPVAIIGYDLWQNHYAGRDDIIGYSARIDGQSRSIVGVLPKGFGFPTSDQLWTPLAPPRASGAGEGNEDLVITGILKQGVSFKQARGEVELLEASIKKSWPDFYKLFDSSVVAPFTALTGEVDPTINLTIVFAIFLLVVFNIGNLFMTRCEERMQELAIRSALGATPNNVVAILLLESAVLCVLGLMLGLLLAHFGLNYVKGALAEFNPLYTASFWFDMSLNISMMTVAIIALALIWLFSGGIPAWRFSRTGLEKNLSTTGKGAGAPRNSLLGKILVNTQLVLACVLISVGMLQVVVLGLAQTELLPRATTTYSGSLTVSEYRRMHQDERNAYLQTMEQVLSAQAGVSHVALVTLMPVTTTGATVPYAVEDRDLRVKDKYPAAFTNAISEHYFDLMELPLIEGRAFTAQDNADSLPVAILDQRLAKQLWPTVTAVGKRIQLNPEKNSPWLTVVGVSAPSIQEFKRLSGQSGTPVVFQPLLQAAPGQVHVLIRSAVPGFDYRTALRSAAAQADRETPLTDLQALQHFQDVRTDSAQANVNVFMAMMALATLISGAATYGLAARAAGRRRVETGIRMALGASTTSALLVFVKDGFKTVMIGLGIGIPLSIASLYFVLSISTASQTSWLLIPLALIICTFMGALVMLANYFPARKIVAMEPADALRYE